LEQPKRTGLKGQGHLMVSQMNKDIATFGYSFSQAMLELYKTQET
jgi:hypothetical protein